MKHINWNQVEKEEDDIEQRCADGLITRKQRNRELRDLRADIRGIAEENAFDAYNDTLSGW